MGQEPRWFDIKYNGLSYEEKRRQYDRDVALYEQKEQIELARREQEANAERIVQATKKAEQDRFNNQLALEVLRQNNENIMRYHKLCDDLGMDYNDIIEFKEWLNNLTPRQIAEHKEVLEKVQNFI